MKLAVSNIAWDPAELDDHLGLIRDLGCHGVELALNAIWPEPVEASAEERGKLKALIRSRGLEAAGFHALLYTRPDLLLFQDRDSFRKTVDYLKRTAAVCADLEGKVMVFGSPKNRRLLGRDAAECAAWAEEGFREVAEAAGSLGVAFCIEPLAPGETEFIRSSEEGMELVRRVGHPAFGLHLDGRALWETGEEVDAVLPRYGKDIRHFHVGDPGLSPPGSSGRIDHPRMGRALRACGYDGYVSIEMRRGFGPSRDVIRRSVAYVKSCYAEKGGT